MGSSSTAETTCGDLRLAIEVDSDEQQFVNALLASNSHGKNDELLKLSDCFFQNSHKAINFHAALQQYLNSPTSFHQLFHDLASLYIHHLLMRETLQSFQNRLSHKLHSAKAWTKVLAVVFTAAVAIISAVGAATARTPAAVAAAAASPVLLGAIGRWAVSLVRKYEHGMKTQDEITGTMLVGAEITIDNLCKLYSSARRVEFHMNRSALETVDSNEVGNKVAASFEELKVCAANFCRDTRSAKSVTLQRLIKHLGYIQN